MSSDNTVLVFVTNGCNDLYVKLRETQSLSILFNEYSKRIGEERVSLIFSCDGITLTDNTSTSSLIGTSKRIQVNRKVIN